MKETENKSTWQVERYLENTAKANGEDVDEVKEELVKHWLQQED